MSFEDFCDEQEPIPMSKEIFKGENIFTQQLKISN